MATNRRAVTFNAAALHEKTLKQFAKNKKALKNPKVTGYYISGEPLHVGQQKLIAKGLKLRNLNNKRLVHGPLNRFEQEISKARKENPIWKYKQWRNRAEIEKAWLKMLDAKHSIEASLDLFKYKQ